MVDEPIDLNKLRTQRQEAKDSAEIDADQARWEVLADQLYDIMVLSDQYHTAVVTATLNSLLSFLVENCDLTLSDARELVSKRLSMFNNPSFGRREK